MKKNYLIIRNDQETGFPTAVMDCTWKTAIETPKVYADIGEIAAGLKPGRESDDERIVSINLGLALDDMAVAIVIYRKAGELGIGTELPL